MNLFWSSKITSTYFPETQHHSYNKMVTELMDNLRIRWNFKRCRIICLLVEIVRRGSARLNKFSLMSTTVELRYAVSIYVYNSLSSFLLTLCKNQQDSIKFLIVLNNVALKIHPIENWISDLWRFLMCKSHMRNLLLTNSWLFLFSTLKYNIRFLN